MAEILVDSAPVLQEGTGTPYIAIFNSKGEPIIESKTGLPLGTFITEFEYVYDEEKEDKGKIDLILNNPSIVDNEDLNYYHTIQLQWGYIYPSNKPFVGPVRRVIVTNRNFKFQAGGLHATIEFSDAGILLRSRPVNNDRSNMGFLNYLKGAIQGIQMGITILDYNREDSKRVAVVKKTGDTVKDEDAALVNRNNQIISAYSTYDSRAPLGISDPKSTGDPKDMVYNSRLDASKEYDDLVPVKLLDYKADESLGSNQASLSNAQLDLMVNQFPEEYRRVIMDETRISGMILMGTNKNRWDQLNEIVNHLPNGPYFPDSRDGKLTFHNQKSNRPVSKVYTWYGGNGELIEFVVDSKYVRSVVEASQKSDIDPDTKSVTTETTQIILNPTDGASDSDLIVRWASDNYFRKRNATNTVGAAVAGTVGGIIGGTLGGIVAGPWGAVAGGAAIGGLAEETVANIGMFKDGYPYHHLPDYKRNHSTANDVAGGEFNNIPYPARVNSYEPSHIKDKFGKSYSDLPLFTGIDNAIKYYQHYDSQWNTDDINAVMEQWKKRYQDLTNTSSPEGRAKALETFQKLDDLIIKRKVRIVQRVYPSYYSSPEYSTEEYANMVKTKGLVKLSDTRVDDNVYYDGYNPKDFYNEGLKNISRVARVISGTEQKEKSPSINDWDKSVMVEYETELEVPISASRVLSSMPDDVMAQAVNDLTETIKNTLTARAKIVGDPTVESSMNLVIRGVSEKYSGTWYAKKVTHHISPSTGYICNIEFTKRVLTNSVTHYFSKTNMVKDKMREIREIASKSSKNNAFDVAKSTMEKLYNQEGNRDKLFIGVIKEDGSVNVQGYRAVLASRPQNIPNADYFQNKGKSWDNIVEKVKQAQNLQKNK